MRLLQVPQGTILELRVKTGARRFEIRQEDELTVFCRKPPIKGMANRELVKELSRLFKKEVKIISGFSSRQKKLLVIDAKVEEVTRTLK